MSDESLKIVMTSLVKVLRELLANMEEEKQAILIQDATTFQTIMNQRSSLVVLMQETQKNMSHEIDSFKAADLFKDDHEKLIHLAQYTGEDKVELLTLRDQILALSEKMEKQNMSNSILLGHNIAESKGKEKYSHPYKPVKRRAYPKKNPITQKKTTVKTIEIHSEEK